MWPFYLEIKKEVSAYDIYYSVYYFNFNYIQPYDFYLYSDLDYFGYSNISLGSEFVSSY